MNETPSKGGSYVREKDGKLKRVASTAPPVDRNAPTAKGGKRDRASVGQAAPAKAGRSPNSRERKLKGKDHA